MPGLEKKRALVLGVANERSIAWAIARALAAGGARIGLTWAGEAIERRVRPLAAEIGAELVLPCDVTDDGQIEALFAEVDRAWGGLDV
ncbi:MAG: SDR family oxidoreductase, partial [Alphaproteobacteria bacterium]